jgi:SAM-dependent methyltransferase
VTSVDALNHLIDRPRVIAEWTRLLKPGGRLLITDPIILTGPMTNSEIAARSSAGDYLFVPFGYDERVIAQVGLQLLVCEDVTSNMIHVAEARRAARASRSSVLRAIEGDQAFEVQQEFLAVAARVARRGSLSRFVYVATKLS